MENPYENYIEASELSKQLDDVILKQAQILHTSLYS